ncbi:MAG: cobalamin biosynthesis protein [Spongiibacteraceae bacterium]
MISIISLTDAGESLARHIKSLLISEPVELYHKPEPFGASVRELFQQGHKLIFICATGIVVRSLAPVINNKKVDPPVLVLDELGCFIIPLISGHEGGANEWGAALADKLNAQLIFTTANPYIKPVYTVGMGCERHCPIESLESLLDECLHTTGLKKSQIKTLASIDIKADEAALIQLALKNNWRFETWPAAALRTVEQQLTQRSAIVFREVGVYGVAEAAALVAASAITQKSAELILPKQKNKQATCSIARSYMDENLNVNIAHQSSN